MCSVDTAQVGCLSKYRKLFLALWQAVKPLKITMTCKKRKKQYVSSYIPMRHTRIYCIRVCAYMHTRMCVYAYAYWADAHYAYILVRTYLSCTVSEENIVVVKDNLYDCPREIDTDVIIAQKLIAPLLGPEGIIVLNSHHAASSELHGLKEPSKLRVASPTGIWRGLGIGKCNIATLYSCTTYEMLLLNII